MHLKIAVCDDEEKQLAYLRHTLETWAKGRSHLTEVQTFSSAEAFLFAYGEDKSFDILLLDIEMGKMNGIELAKTLRRENSAIQIIFVTGYYEYFSDGFDVSALHYLIKPVSGEKLFPVLDRAAHNLAYRQRSVLLATVDGDIKVPLADIVYIESENVYVLVHTAHGTFRMRAALGKFVQQLDETFFKVHRSYVVGLKYVKKITRTEVTMANGDTLPISRGLYDDVHAALIKYL